jgi:hypothetical protein
VPQQSQVTTKESIRSIGKGSVPRMFEIERDKAVGESMEDSF